MTVSGVTSRLRSIDLLRGIACVLMAIDHVRVYSGLPAGGPTAGIFFTRWITHFVAPAFCFFAGTGAFFHERKLGDVRALSRFLLTRGALLVLLELTVIRVSWTFNLRFDEYNLAGVIWMLGVCMMLMAALVRLAPKTVGIVGVTIIALQQIIGLIGRALPESLPAPLHWLFQVLYLGGQFSLGAHGPPLAILFVIVPWIGVMSAGYGFGLVLLRDDNERRRACLRIGLGATAAFLVLAGAIVLLTKADADAPPVLFRLLGQQKYPASQLFLLMTLGPTIALIPWAEHATGWFADAMVTFGRVPMFYYLLHIPTIHMAAIIVSLVRTGVITPWLFGNFPLRPSEQPDGYQWSLWMLYLVWAIVLPLLYLGCRWYARVKAQNPRGIAAYI